MKGGDEVKVRLTKEDFAKLEKLLNVRLAETTEVDVKIVETGGIAVTVTLLNGVSYMVDSDGTVWTSEG